MSWDVMIFNFKEPPPESIIDVDLDPIPLGDVDEVRSNISKSIDDIDWSDPAWGQLIREEFVIEFNLQESGVVKGFMLHIRGGGNPLKPVTKMCSENGWYPLDMSSGGFIDVENRSLEGWEGFQEYRDRVIRDLNK